MVALDSRVLEAEDNAKIDFGSSVGAVATGIWLACLGQGMIGRVKLW